MGDGTRDDLDGRLTCYACGARHDNASAKHLPDGTVVGLHSKEFALYCEARFVIKMRSKKARQDYLDLVEQKRGLDGKDQLAKEIMRWWNVSKQSVSESSGKPAMSAMREGGRNTSGTRELDRVWKRHVNKGS